MPEPAGDGHALLLSTRQPAREMTATVAEVHLLEQFVGAGEGGLAVHPREVQRHGDVLTSSQRRDEVERLEHEPDLVTPVRIELLA